MLSGVEMGLYFDSRVPAAAVRACTPPRQDLVAAGDELSELTLGSTGFSRSWRRRPSDPFPSYEDLWEQICADYSCLREVLTSRQIPEPPISEYELTYVNPVTADERWSVHRGRQRRMWDPIPVELAAGYLSNPEAVSSDFSFAMRDDDDRRVGRLRVVLHQLQGETTEPLTGMTITARGVCGGVPVEQTKCGFDLAFKWIVRAFASFNPSFVIGH